MPVERGQPRLAFGLTAGRRPWLEELATAIEALGYDELWSNDVPGTSGLDTLAVVAGATRRLRLAVGAIALSRRSPAQVGAEVQAQGMPTERLTVGVGSGSWRSLHVVRAGIAQLRAELRTTPSGWRPLGRA